MEEFIFTNSASLAEASGSESVHENQTQEASLKLRHHFSNEEDLHLLREVVKQNPFGSRGKRGQVWESIENSMRERGFDCIAKSCQDRLSRLLRTFVSEESRRSAICGQMMANIPEVGGLLQQIIHLKQQGGQDIAPIRRHYKESSSVEIDYDNASLPMSHDKAVGEITTNANRITSKRTAAEVEENIAAQASTSHTFLSIDTEMHRLKRAEIDLKREEIELKKQAMMSSETESARRFQLDEMKFKKQAELDEMRLRVEAEKNALEKERLALERSRQEMDRRKQELEIAERTQQLETMRQQQQVLLQFLTKKLADE